MKKDNEHVIVRTMKKTMKDNEDNEDSKHSLKLAKTMLTDPLEP